MKNDPHAIAAKWVRIIGIGFHPDTRGDEYSPPLSDEMAAQYENDMSALFESAQDPYECCVMALADAGLLSDNAE